MKKMEVHNMKKYFLSILLFGFLLSAFASPAALAVQKPDYEKFGRIATAVIKEDYPGEEVVDYQYQGRQALSENTAADLFEFQVKEGQKTKTVVVRVSHDTVNDKLISLSVEEKK
jgi:Protein of unknown function (DUF3889)